MRKSLISIILTMAIVFSIIFVMPSAAAQAAPTINIGDYIQMGRYYDEPILWRCVDIDANGPLMLAYKILTIKPFDGAGNHKYADGTVQSDSEGAYVLTKKGWVVLLEIEKSRRRVI